MGSVLRSVKKRKKSRRLGEVEIIRREEYDELELDSKVETIRALVPLGLMHVAELLDDEVTELAGERYARKDGVDAWTTSREQSWHGRPRRSAGTDSGSASSQRHGWRDSAAILRGVAVATAR